MTKKLFILVIFLLVSILNIVSLWNYAFAQSVDTAWVRRYNGPGNGYDRARAIAVDRSGNVYVTGYSDGSGTSFDYATVKYDPSGNELWVRRYNGPGNDTDYANAIAVDGSGNVYVTGYSYGSGTSYDYATVKYYLNGDTAWVRRYNGPGNGWDFAFAIAVDGSGNVYVTGWSGSSGTFNDYATVKYYPNGDTAWVRRYNGPGNDWDDATAIAVDGSNNVYVTGFSGGSGTRDDYATIKYYSNGDTAWVRRYNGPRNGWDWAYAIAVDGSNNAYVTGYSYDSGTSYDYATIKYYPSGDTAWVRRYNGPGNDYDGASAIAVDGSNNVYVTGFSGGSGTSDDYATIKYHSNGDTAWVRRYNGPGNSDDDATAIAVDSFGNVYVTGYSYGSGTSYDYATIMYYPNGDTALVRRYNGPGNDWDDATAIAVDGSNNVYVTGVSEGDYATIKYVQGSVNRTLLLKDASASHNPIDSKTFKIYKVANDPPTLSETYMGELTTDGNGKISLPAEWFSTGDWVKVERLVQIEPAIKHKTILPNMYYIKIDNGKFDTNTGAISYHILSSDEEQEVIVDHTTIMYDLLVSVEWDADQQYLDGLVNGFRLMSNYLYDVTDGQMYLNKVVIYDDAVNWDSADLQIYANNSQIPESMTRKGNICFGGGISSPSSARIFFPRISYFNDHDGNRNLTYDLYPYNWTIAQTIYRSLDRAYPPSRTLAHEFGHYGIGFLDEYEDRNGNQVFPPLQGGEIYDFGLMDDELKVGVAQNSEMSSSVQYSDVSHRVTEQWTERGNRSCWDYFECSYQGTYDGIFCAIKKPSTEMFAGPNDNLQNLNYNVGSLLQPRIENYDGDAFTLVVIAEDQRPAPTANAAITLIKQNGRVIHQGNTADNGGIRCLGVNYGDSFRASHGIIDSPNLRFQWAYGESMVGSSSFNRLKNSYRTSANGDSMIVVLRSVQGNYKMNNGGLFESENHFTYNLRVNRFFTQNPTLEFYSPSWQIYNYNFSTSLNGYEVTLDDSLGSNGMFSVIAVDDSGYSFFVNNSYTVTYFSDSLFSSRIYGPQGACELGVDALNTSFQKIFILSSDFPPLLNDMDSLVEQGGAVHSICAYPNISSLNGLNNYLIIRYSDVDLKNSPEMSLKIFKWNETSHNWGVLCSKVDTTRNEVTAPINTLGIYGAFTINYLQGDANNDKNINLADVIYLANYVLKGGPSPIPLQSGDVNCDGKYDLVDVIKLARYVLFGELFPC
jgi:hypothetical protein